MKRQTEAYVRKAQTRMPDGTVVERDWTARERYMLYVRGFRDGASVRAMRFPGLGAYDLGYADGRAARHAAVEAYAKQIGYEPTVLRSAEPSSGDKT